MLWGEVSARWDKWIAQCHGYSRLRNSRISRGCQTMLGDRPTLAPTCQNITAPTRASADELNNVNLSGLSLDGNKEEMRFFEKQMRYDQDVANYIAFLDRPVINVNDHYIEIHRYQVDLPVRPPTRRRRHRTEAVEAKSVSGGAAAGPETPALALATGVNQNNGFVSGDRWSDEENRRPTPTEEQQDRHRALSQAPRVRRGQTFAATTAAAEAAPGRGFLGISFRASRKNQTGRRRKRSAAAAGERGGADGPVLLPAVLLTFDRPARSEHGESGP